MTGSALVIAGCPTFFFPNVLYDCAWEKSLSGMFIHFLFFSIYQLFLLPCRSLFLLLIDMLNFTNFFFRNLEKLNCSDYKFFSSNIINLSYHSYWSLFLCLVIFLKILISLIFDKKEKRHLYFTNFFLPSVLTY